MLLSLSVGALGDDVDDVDAWAQLDQGGESALGIDAHDDAVDGNGARGQGGSVHFQKFGDGLQTIGGCVQ